SPSAPAAPPAAVSSLPSDTSFVLHPHANTARPPSSQALSRQSISVVLGRASRPNAPCISHPRSVRQRQCDPNVSPKSLLLAHAPISDTAVPAPVVLGCLVSFGRSHCSADSPGEQRENKMQQSGIRRVVDSRRCGNGPIDLILLRLCAAHFHSSRVALGVLGLGGRNRRFRPLRPTG